MLLPILNPSPSFSTTVGHKDSVTSVLFSHDSSLVATGDMSGLIKVWKVETKQEVWSFEVGDLEVRKNAARPKTGCAYLL